MTKAPARQDGGSRRVMAQLLNQQALPAKLIESGTGRGRVGDLVVEVENILPGLAVYRA